MMHPSITLPESLSKMVMGYNWQQVTIGESPAKVFCLKKGQQPTYYLKIAHQLPRRDLEDESSVLNWLRDNLPVPQVLYFGEDQDHDYLLLSEIPGTDAASLPDTFDKAHLVKLLAQGLRMIHEIPVAGCPFDRTLSVEIDNAKHNVTHSLLDDGDFDDERIGLSAQKLFEELLQKKPDKEDLVFTHGDYCLPNIIILGDKISGFIDLHRAGIADRYKDLALAVRSIHRNLGAGLEPFFFNEYGITEPEQEKIEYYKLLDEFF